MKHVIIIVIVFVLLIPVNAFSTSDNVIDSKCGAGTVFDDVSNSCVLEGNVVVGENNTAEVSHKCGAGTVFDEKLGSCVLEGSTNVEESSHTTSIKKDTTAEWFRINAHWFSNDKISESKFLIFFYP